MGSVPLSNAEEVFRWAGEELGGHLRRVPDGETGDRVGWVAWQGRNFKLPELELVKPVPGQYPPTPRFRPKHAGIDLTRLEFPELGFADAALASYPVFARLKEEGTLREELRFQVALPTPLAPVAMFIVDEHQAEVLPVYQAKMREDVERILAAIPHDQLAIQWDVCIEVWMWERWLSCPFEHIEDGLVAHVAEVGSWIPPKVELGHHYCYGDFQHEHFHQPTDAAVLTDMATRMVGATRRAVNWVHLPVPIDRTDDAFYLPFERLELPADTEVYLGLVHSRDGIAGTRARVEMAAKHVPVFGVACECGMGRRPPGRGGDEDGLRALLATHAALSEPVA